MADSNHYTTLEVNPAATQDEIKQAYRRLAKLFHPDSNRSTANHDRIASINAAYEVLGDPQSRRSYDRWLSYVVSEPGDRRQPHRRDRNPNPDAFRKRRTGRNTDEQIQQWLKQVYQPVNRRLCQILRPLQIQIDNLAADPFDDELMEDFQIYLEDCRDWLIDAQLAFQSMPNPANMAGAAANLYYSLNQVADGISDLERFTYSYVENYLHTGQELFRIADRLRNEAQEAIRTVAT